MKGASTLEQECDDAAAVEPQTSIVQFESNFDNCTKYYGSDSDTPLEKGSPTRKRTLKVQLSEVSLDSQGFPNILNSPEKIKTQPAKAPFFLRNRRRRTSNTASASSSWAHHQQNELKAALGFEETGEPTSAVPTLGKGNAKKTLPKAAR